MLQMPQEGYYRRDDPDSGGGSMWLNFLTSRMSTKVGITGLHITFDRRGMTE